MDLDHLDGFTVYLRIDSSHAQSPDEVERPVARFASFSEALRFLRARHHWFAGSVIRYEGDTGCGD